LEWNQEDREEIEGSCLEEEHFGDTAGGRHRNHKDLTTRGDRVTGSRVKTCGRRMQKITFLRKKK